MSNQQTQQHGLAVESDVIDFEAHGARIRERSLIGLPLDLSLNDGTYMAQGCVDVLQRCNDRLALRHYTTTANDRVRETIADVDGVTPDRVFLRCGSGPILKQAVPWIIKKNIMASPTRIFRHVTSKSGYPIITPHHTYSKVPRKSAELGLTVHFVPLTVESGFRVDPADLEAALQKGDGLVYLANPNNPTGNVLIDREGLEPLLRRYPKSTFWIDEAYVQYVDPAKHQPMSELVMRHDNLVVSRTFSFAYGLAGVRIGYLLAKPEMVSALDKQLTGYRLGWLQEELAIAAMRDKKHLPWLREECGREVHRLRDGMGRHAGIETFPSDVNFVFARFTDGRTGAELKARMERRGIKIKAFDAVAQRRYDEWFRVTLGTAAENVFFLQELDTVLAGW
jgi:histidinol-phosphate aminotransferase